MTTILMYHGIGDQPAPRGELRYTVSTRRFEDHLDLIQRRAPGRVITLDDMLGGMGRRDGLVLTFDDGEASVAGAALPAMARRGFAGTVFITSGWVGRPGYLSPGDVKLLVREGWTVGAHGATHRYLASLGDGELSQELSQSKEELEDLIEAEVVHMSLPGGRADRRVVAAVRRAGYRSLCTSRPGRCRPEPSPHSLSRMIILRGTGHQTFSGIVDGHWPTYLQIVGRAALLDGAKRLLGDRRYDHLRGKALGLLKRG